jgi:hypothetical protein
MSGRRRQLTPEQHREVAERSLKYLRLRVLAAEHSPTQLAKEMKISVASMRDYMNRHRFANREKHE